MLPDLLRPWGASPGFEAALPWLAGIFIAAYLLGAVPFGILISRAMGLGDLRKIGSGNIGATNVLRTGSKRAALATVILDGGKGAAAVLIAAHFYGGFAGQIAGLGAFIGHLFPIYLRFRGGKGVATFLGIMLAVAFPAGLAACLTWLAVAFVFRISSLSALVASASSPLWLAAFDHHDSVWLSIVLILLVWWRHRENLARLLRGSEPKIGAK